MLTEKQNTKETTSTVMHMNFVGPRVVSQTIEANKKNLTLDFQDGRGSQSITIEKGDNCYMWVDHEMSIRRKFDDAENLRWEYELPYDMIPQLEAMKSGECNQEVNMNWGAAMEYYATHLRTIFEGKPKPGAKGSNVTPKKKKRKK